MTAINNAVSVRYSKFLSMMIDAANKGEDCPPAKIMCEEAGYYGRGGITKTLNRMVQRGAITVAQFDGFREITICATGRKTIIPAHKGQYIPSLAEPAPVNFCKGDNLPRVDRDPCHVCGIRKDVCTGHNIKPVQYIPAHIWKGLTNGVA